MRLRDPFVIAYRSFEASRLRFFLTTLGVIIGVASVILVMSIGASAQRLVLSQIENVGSNLIGVLPGASQESGPPASALGVVTTTLTPDDLRAMRQPSNVPHLVAVSGYVTGSVSLESDYESLESSFQGVSPEMREVENLPLAEGRFLYPEEEFDLSRVAVLGAKRAEELFPGRSAVGETVRMKGSPFTVVGVLEERGASILSNPDTAVYVPLGTAQKLLLGIEYLNFIRGKVDTAENIERTIEDVRILLRDRHDIDTGDEEDYSIRSTEAALGVLSNITDALKYFLTAIASVSLLVGGIGIMNSMLISVSQLIREVGLRKAVGARPDHILWQFLAESVVITLLGGFVGILGGVGIAFAASLIIPRFGYEWEFIIPAVSIALGLGVSLAIGMIFGVYPARKAAKISPLEALRYE